MGAKAGLSVLCVLISCGLVLSSSAPITNKLVDLIVRRKYDEFIQELSLAPDMDANLPDSKGRLPLSEAVRTKDIKFVDALIQFGALANSREPATKAAPIQFAFQNGLTEIAKMLLAYGADINAADKGGAKPRDFAPTIEIAELIKKWDKEGAQGFEDAPGTWMKATNDKGEEYWYNAHTSEARWNTPPSCAWQRIDHQGQPHEWKNYITGQTVTKTPLALAWRLLNHEGQEVWYNWRANISQVGPPDELSDELKKEASKMKNLRWYNPKTEEFSWEDPKLSTPWREINGKEGTYYYNVVTGESEWEAPVELAWKEVPSEEHAGQKFWHNPHTGESTWEKPGLHAWEKHDSDL